MVLDAWAVLSWLKGECPAADRVREVFLSAERGKAELFICMINLGEVYYRVCRLLGEKKADAILSDIKLVPIKIISATDDLVIKSASLKAKFSISYADAFAMATALEKGAVLLTGDNDFKEIGKNGALRIELLKRE